MKLRVSLAFLTLAATTTASIAPVAQDDRCIGFDIDFSRIRSLSTNDIAMLMSETIDGSKTYSRSQISRIQANGSSNQAAPPKCLGTRHRLQERVNGVPIYGADVIITINNCDNEQGDTNDSEYSLSEEGSLLTLFGRIPETAIQSIHGHQFSSINEPRGYVPTKTATEALSTMTNMLDIPTNAVGDLVLEVYVSTGGDFLAYLAYAIVEKGTSTELVHIVVDAHDLSLLSQCTLTSGRSEAYRQRHLRATKELFSAYSPQHAHRTLFNCKSCAEHISVLWFGNQTTCPIYSLYLDDPSHSTICTVGKNREDNSIVLGPGPVDELFWKGTLNCNGTTTCTSVVLPTCRDALSDVQFGGITTMTYLRDYLGYRGGLKEDSAFPVSVKAHAHYQDEYCNAFYSPATNSVYFGDCNCRTWSPLVSLDIIAHEIGRISSCCMVYSCFCL